VTLQAIRIVPTDGVGEETREKMETFLNNFCARLRSLDQPAQRVFIDELNHFVTFYDPEHLIRP